MHIQSGNEISCNKLLSALKSEQRMAIQFGSTGRAGSMRMSQVILKHRLEAARVAVPVVFYRAVCALGVLGTRFFSGPPQIPHYPFGETVAHAYAIHLRGLHEKDA